MRHGVYVELAEVILDWRSVKAAGYHSMIVYSGCAIRNWRLP